MKLSSRLFRLSRKVRDIEVIAKPWKVPRRVKNKVIGRKWIRKFW